MTEVLVSSTEILKLLTGCAGLRQKAVIEHLVCLATCLQTLVGFCSSDRGRPIRPKSNEMQHFFC